MVQEVGDHLLAGARLSTADRIGLGFHQSETHGPIDTVSRDLYGSNNNGVDERALNVINFLKSVRYHSTIAVRSITSDRIRTIGY